MGHPYDLKILIGHMLDTNKIDWKFFQTGRGANRDQPTGEQLIEFAVSVNKKVTTRLHNEWMKGII